MRYGNCTEILNARVFIFQFPGAQLKILHSLVDFPSSIKKGILFSTVYVDEMLFLLANIIFRLDCVLSV